MAIEFTHPKPLEKAPERPEPPKNFEQLLHDFIINWKQKNPLDDGHFHAMASKMIFELYASLSQRGWDDNQIKQYFKITNFNDAKI